MANEVFSFSVKTKEEKDLVLELKKQCRLKGISFSHVVMTAIKTQQTIKTVA